MSNPPQRIFWLDFMRVVSCWMVIAVHACDPYNLLTPPGEPPFWGALLGSLMRPCVPLFIMISGALLLPSKLPIGEFYKKRFSRVLIPFIIWSILYAVVPVFFGHTILLDNSTPYDWNSVGTALFTSLFNFYGETWHMWYLYALLGLYLFIPFISPFIEKATKRQLQCYLGIWGVTLLLPYIRLIFPMIHGEASWNDQSMLEPFTGFMGFMILAHYLRKFPLAQTWSKVLTIAIPLFIAGFLFTWFGFQHSFYYQDKPTEFLGGLLTWGDPTALEIKPAVLLEQFWWYLSINVVAMSIAMFIVMEKVTTKSIWIQKFFAEISKLSFGIFLIHLFFIYNMYRWTLCWDLPPWLGIPVNATITMIISYAIIKLISKFPKAKYLIG